MRPIHTRGRLSVALAALLAIAACGQGPETREASHDDRIVASELPIRFRTPVQQGTFDQAIDHAGPSPGTFKQRYYYSTEFADGPDSPVIFRFCGESPCLAWHLTMFGDTAKSLHAAVVVLEHRYYGQSLPFTDLSLQNMKYLTIHNALEDAASFQAFAREQLGLRGKWIAVGGSYSGMLAAFYREKHPELVVGAWASSAPVDVQKSFSGYDAITSRSLGPRCTLLFQAALQTASVAFDDPEKIRVLAYRLFRSAPYSRKVDFLRGISYMAMDAAQNGAPEQLCSALEQHADAPMEGLIGFRNPPLVPDDPAIASPATGPGGVTTAAEPPTLATGAGTPLFEPPPEPAPAEPAPQVTGLFQRAVWRYQVCTEIGFYQVHNPNRAESVLPDLVDESVFDETCVRFGLTTPDAEKTRATYYEPIAAGQVSNLFFVNGALDPWSALSFVDPSANLPGGAAYVVRGGAHCSDLTTLYRGSLLGVFESHVKFHDLARRWLAD